MTRQFCRMYGIAPLSYLFYHPCTAVSSITVLLVVLMEGGTSTLQCPTEWDPH